MQRFIPAHAGNTCLNSSRTASKKVHPRSRGEYDKAVTDQTHVMGSSPLTRGIRMFTASRIDRNGFIPAHAGNTGCCPFCFQDIQVHPRSRGEYIGLFSKQIAYRGSSPLTRGIRFVHLNSFLIVGFIPAHAGNTIPLNFSFTA